MPIQTKKKANIYFPDGARVLVKASATDTNWYDLGAINSAINATLNWDEVEIETANAGALDTRINNMTVAGDFTLINLNAEGVGKLGGGMFNIQSVRPVVSESGASTIALSSMALPVAGMESGVLYGFDLVDALGNTYAIDGDVTDLVTSVYQTDASGTSTTWASASYSVYNDGIIFNSAISAAAGDFTIEFGYLSASESGKAISAGSSTLVLKAFAMRIEHEDDTGKIDRSLDLYAVNSQSGGFQFNFKGANEDGIEEMPLSFTARLDSNRNDKNQLLTWFTGSKTPTTYV